MSQGLPDVELDRLLAAGRIEQFDRYWVRLLGRLDPDASARVLLCAAMARRAVDDGHVCLDLAAPAAFDDLPAWPPLDELLAELARSPLVGDGAGPTPLVLAGTRLYLHRYWRDEQELASFIRQRAARAMEGIDQDRLAACLAAVFAGSTVTEEQRQACAAVFARRLGAITGGPGTGKTTVVAGLLALIALYAMESGGPPPRMLLLAPTGKAAARLSEAMQRQKGGLPMAPEVLACLPDQAMTIHRALGYQPRNPNEFRHHAGNPLPHQVVVVDEASMVDVTLMTRLFAAVSPEARLVLLGDRDQLASVEAGSILADICEAAGEEDAPAGLAAGVVMLRTSFRFGDSAISRLAGAVNRGEVEEAARLCAAGEEGIALLPPLAGNDHEHPLARLLIDGYRDLLGATTPGEALELLERFRVLVALRRGPLGVEAMNRRIEAVLAREGLIAPSGGWYQGRPILVRENSYRLRLFNGDTGVLWPESGSGEPRAFFFGEDRETVRAFAPSQLPAHETAFAMTIHQSQGSEFDEVVLMLPPADSPLLGRELLYTGITRARRRVTLIGREEEIAAAINRRATRASGLRTLLAGSG
ncbi:MAG: exodeoxyribonuclease V subunit alpha [Thermodesulfobacteriota bacterium]